MLSQTWWLTNSLSPKMWRTKFVVPKSVTHKPSPFFCIYCEKNNAFVSTIMTHKFVVSEIMTHKARCPTHKQFQIRFRYNLVSCWVGSLLATKILIIRRLVPFSRKGTDCTLRLRPYRRCTIGAPTFVRLTCPCIRKRNIAIILTSKTYKATTL